MISFFLNLINAPKYVLNFPTLNRLGLQKFRIKFKLRELNKKPFYNLTDESLKIFTELEKNGIVVLQNYLSSQEIQELDTQIEKMRSEKKFKYEIGKEGGLVQWEHGNFPTGFSKVIESKFRNNSFLTSIISNYTHRKILFLPEVIFQKLSILNQDTDEEDVQTVLHVDRYFRTLKVFYTVSDYTPENGAFWFAPGSQQMSDKRMFYEHEYSVRQSLDRSGHKKTNSELLEIGRNSIHPEFKKDFPEKQMCTPRNSLIIVDVSGFHKRGLISPGHSRETIRINYHYLHAPYFSQYLFKFMKKAPGRYLN